MVVLSITQEFRFPSLHQPPECNKIQTSHKIVLSIRLMPTCMQLVATYRTQLRSTRIAAVLCIWNGGRQVSQKMKEDRETNDLGVFFSQCLYHLPLCQEVFWYCQRAPI